MTGAEVIVATLEQAGVRVVFGLPGVHNLPLWEALRESSVRLVGVRHEQAAAYAADGYSRATGEVGVALTTTGPGAANTLAAVGEAWASHSRVLVIATDIPTSLKREGVHRGALHEMEGQWRLFRPLTEAGFLVERADELPVVVAEALACRDRPRYLEVPTDLLKAQCGEPEPVPGQAQLASLPRDWIDASLLADGSERPLIWVGSGARNARRGVVALAERLAAPVLSTYGGRGVVAASHPCAVDVPPHSRPAGRLWDEADLVIAIGSDLDGMNTQNWAQPQPPHLIAINLESLDATKNYRADHVMVGFAELATDWLAREIAPREGLEDLRARLRHVCAEACADLDGRALEFLDAMSFAVPDDAVIVPDMCIPGYWIAGFHKFEQPRKLLYPVGWGTLGFAFPAAIGAALADRGPTVAVCGDGGFLFACGELATVAQERIPLVTVIVDDGGYGMLRFDQRKAGVPEFGVDLQSPDFASLAGAFGVAVREVDGLGESFGHELATLVEAGEPSVLVAHVDEPLPPPPNTSPQWYRAASASASP